MEETESPGKEPQKWQFAEMMREGTKLRMNMCVEGNVVSHAQVCGRT